MIKQVNGNLVSMLAEGKLDIIVHGCNCQNLMSAGIALEIATIFPEAYFADEYNTRKGDIKKLSNWTAAGVRTQNGEGAGIVINLYTQYNPGKELNLAALELGLYKLSLSLTKTDNRIGFPLIGCGIAGGDWDVVLPLIQKYFGQHDVTIVNYKP